jgi:toxin YoeB
VLLTRRGEPSLAMLSLPEFSEAWDDSLYGQRHDRKTLHRINRLIEEIRRDPFTGISKPEPLRYALAGYWSRRIDDEHRIVCRSSTRHQKILRRLCWVRLFPVCLN